MKSNRETSKQVLIYLPVIHAGYEKLLLDHSNATEILVMGRSFHELYPQLRKDIRAVSPDRAVRMARLIIPGVHIRVLEFNDLEQALFADLLVMPDEDIMHDLADKYQLECKHEVFYETAFLRWDRSRAELEREVASDEDISEDSFYQMLAAKATAEATKSPDWWRQVGAVAWKDSEILYAAFNDHRPSHYIAGIEGDPRGNFRGGIRTDLSLAEHAEAWVIARAAYDGVSLKGAKLGVNTFPCPPCARLIATAGIEEVVFQTGYALVEGDLLLKTAGVRIIRVAPVVKKVSV